MNPCKFCPFWRRLFCIFACAEANEVLARIEALITKARIERE